MNAGTIAAIVAIIGALILATRGSRWRSMPPKRLAMMAGAWVAIILAVVLLIRLMGLSTAH